jgi:hypothetical protein
MLDARYARLASQWLTPVEIFKPHYAVGANSEKPSWGKPSVVQSQGDGLLVI